MKTRLLTWNPKHIGADGEKWLQGVVRQLKRTGRRKSDQWSCGPIRNVAKGERVFLLRQGSNSPGLIGSGWVTRKTFEAPHWLDEKSDEGSTANFVEVEWDSMVDPHLVLRRDELLRHVLPESLLNTQWSGREIQKSIAKSLELHWEKHLNSLSEGIVRVSRRTSTETENADRSDDSMDDLADQAGSDLGSDGAPIKTRIISGVSRDPAVRRAVLKRSKQTCERPGCGAHRAYLGFIDVHHILTAAKSDRTWTCVALCPNCHREAHCAPNRIAINNQLQRFAVKFK